MELFNENKMLGWRTGEGILEEGGVKRKKGVKSGERGEIDILENC